MTIGLKFLLCINGKIFGFIKAACRYAFSVAINGHVFFERKLFFFPEPQLSYHNARN